MSDEKKTETFSEQPFKVGDIVVGKGNLGIPAAIRNFKPLKDAEKEQKEYKTLHDSWDGEPNVNFSKFCASMVYPPWEGGRRYRIIEGEEYEILVAGIYNELFVKSKGTTSEVRGAKKDDSQPKKVFATEND